MSSALSTRRISRKTSARTNVSTTSELRKNHKSHLTRHLTCANCRLRKTKCDGSQPGCKTCEVYQDDCHYDKPPPMTQIIAMSQRLQECEKIIQTLTKASSLTQMTSSFGERLSNQHSTMVSGHDSEAERNLPHESHDSRSSVSDNMPKVTDFSAELSDLSLDGKGELCYYGPTSAVHEPPVFNQQPRNSVEIDRLSSEQNIRTNLASNAMQSREWEDLALGNAAMEMEIPRHVLSELMQLHWSWIAPLFMWVYRPAFMRDMMTGGPYYTQFLTIVLCAHSSRFQENSVGSMLIGRARLLLGREIQKPSSIPTVQALLQLSARDLAFGSISQAWLYSGMAFRMVSDLGLHHSSGKMLDLGKHSAEDLEIRRRLFWSCYFWDKAISLYLGRVPTLTELPFDHVPMLFDHTTEYELWVPYYGTSPNADRVPPRNYPPMKSHAISCFENSCKLAVILSDIILKLYSRNSRPNLDSELRAIRERLDHWREGSPEHLKCYPESLPNICPPPHIVTQNLLYYTTIILLHRPFNSSAVHHKACCEASDSIEKLLLLIEKTFGFTRITYLMAYCVYTAASVRVRDVGAGYANSDSTLSTFLRALRGGCTTCPVLQRSLDIINNSLSNQVSAVDNPMNQSTDPFNNSHSLPAFPVYNRQTDLPDTTNVELASSDSFLSLDFFPEDHFDMNTNDWYVPS